MNWRPIQPDEPKIGEPVVVYNGIRAWATMSYMPGVTSSLAKYPATHYSPLELPYAPVEPDRTEIEKDRRAPR